MSPPMPALHMAENPSTPDGDWDFDDFASSSSLFVHSVDAEGRLTSVSETLLEALGHPREALLGRPLSELLHADQGPGIPEILSRHLPRGRSLGIEVHWTTVSGDRLVGREHLVPHFANDGAYAGASAVFVDWTRQREREHRLTEALDAFRQVTEQSPAVYELYDVNGLQVDVNAAYEKLWGFPREHTVGKFNIFESEEVAARGLLPYARRAYAGESVRLPPYEYDPRGRTEADGLGRTRWLRTQIYPLKDTAGAVTSIVVTHEDITDTMRAEQALVESEAKYRDIFESSLDAICILDADKNYIDVNRATVDLTGYSREEMVKMKVADIVHPDDQEHSRRTFDELDRSGYYTTFEGRILTKQGETRYIEVNSNVIFEDGVAVGSRDFIRDITERRVAENKRRDLEHQLFLSQKMESVGRLAGGIAHDFNNILASVMGYAELLSEAFPDTTTLEGEAASVILRGAERASHLTRQLLGFARRGKYNPVPLDMNETIRDVVRMSANIFEERVRVTYDLAPDIPPVRADKSQVDQVLTNLIINARDAMPDGGHLTLVTELVELEGWTPGATEELPPGRYVRASVRDTGAGIPQDVLDRIFEPFFSTKAEGKGTGLGLATVYGIVKNHRGAIDVRTELGVGSTFDILLPTADGPAAESEEPGEVEQGSGVILIIDDAEDVRYIMARQLESLGYSVLQAEDGVEGVASYRDNVDDIDLVFLDMVMPNMGGEETFAALTELNPDVKVILVTGFSQEGRAAGIMKEGVSGFLPKPFRRSTLARTVSQALEGTAAQGLNRPTSGTE